MSDLTTGWENTTHTHTHTSAEERSGRYITSMVIEQQMELAGTHSTLCFDTNTHTLACAHTHLFRHNKNTLTQTRKNKLLLPYGDEISRLKINTQP